MPSLLDAVVRTTKISKALKATRAGPSDGADILWSHFARVVRGESETFMYLLDLWYHLDLLVGLGPLGTPCTFRYLLDL